MRRPIRRAARRPFGRLVAHFLARLVRGGQEGATDEFELTLGPLLGLLAAPGAISCLVLLQKYSSLLNWIRGIHNVDVFATSLPEKHMYISLAMAVCGIVTVLKWDRIVPDSQDYLNLAPLPVRPRTVLLSNVAAILIAVAVIAFTVNAIPSILFPLFVAASGHLNGTAALQFAGVHLLCVTLASVFAVCAVFALLGTLSAVLPRAVFRAISSWVRGAFLLAFLALLLSGFAGSELVQRLERFPDSPLQRLPSLWYLGLYQRFQHRATPALAELAGTALSASAAALLLMAISYAIGYRRRFAAVLEGASKVAALRLSSAILAVLDLFAHRRPGFRQACHRFVVRALLRSETPRLVIAVSLGLGWLLALLSRSIEAGPLICSFLLILGLRIAFELPIGLPANWIFRGILDPKEHDTSPVARRVMLSFLAPLVLAPCFAVAWWQWGTGAAVLHALYVLALSWSLTGVLLAGYRKLPLTCPMPGFRNDFLMLCLLHLLGFLLFIRIGVTMERWMFRMPVRFLLVPAVMFAAWYWNRRRTIEARQAGELEEGLLFENAPVRTVEQLNLSDTV